MRKLYRSKTDRKLSGICGGLGQMLNIDATILRLVAVIAAFCSFGSAVVIYLLASVIIPEAPSSNFSDGPDYY